MTAPNRVEVAPDRGDVSYALILACLLMASVMGPGEAAGQGLESSRRPGPPLSIGSDVSRHPGPDGTPPADPADGGGVGYGHIYNHSVTYLVLSGAVGGITAGVRAWGSGHEVLRAIIGGTFGGMIGNAGVALAVRAPSDLSFAGVALAAAGGSITANAGAGEGLIDRLVLPVGPVYLEAGRRTAFRARVSVVRGFRTACLAADPAYRLDARASLARLTPHWHARGPAGVGTGRGLCRFDFGDGASYAMALSGNTVFADWQDHWHPLDQTLAHEMGHIAQHARADAMASLDLGVTLSRRLGAPGWLVLDVVQPYAMVNAGLRLLAPATDPYRASWYEREVLSAQGIEVCLDHAPFRCHW